MFKRLIDDWMKRRILDFIRPRHFGVELRSVYHSVGLIVRLSRFVLIIEELHREGRLQRGFRHDGTFYESFDLLPRDAHIDDVRPWVQPTDMT